MEGIESLAEQYASVNIAVEGARYRPILDQIKSNRTTSLDSFYKDLDRVFGWISANPSREDRINSFKQLYVTAQHNENDSNLVARLISLISSETPEFGVIVGKRGSGKTALTNYVLTVHHRDLQAKGITWVRADIAKLHALNEELVRQGKVSIGSCWSVNDYMALHAFFVMIEYGANDDVLKFSMSGEKNHPQNSTSPIEKRLAATSDKLAAHWKLIRLLDDERRRLLLAGRLKKANDHDLKWYFSNIHGKIDSAEINKLYSKIFEIIRDDYKQNMGEFPKIVFVFDGVDNIRADEHAPKDMWLDGRSARSWYFGYLGELQQYLKHAGGCLPYDKCLFVIRNDTEEDLGEFPLAHQQIADGASPRIEIQIPDITKLFSAKLVYTKNSEEHCVSLQGPEEKSERLAQFAWFFEQFSTAHIDALRRSLRIRRKPYTISDVVDITFNGNIRSFSRNIIRSFIYLHQFAKYQIDFQNCRSSEERTSFLKSHIPLIFEGSTLAGNNYMKPNFDQSTKGRWCPNFFEFEDSTTNRWDGLVILRVLQSTFLDEDEQPPPTLNQIKKSLFELGYSDRCVHIAVYTCLEYGLIELYRQINNIELGIQEFSINKTRKGAFLQNMVFSNVTTLYLIATGCRYSGINPENTADSKSNPYLHKITPPRFFSASAIRTVSHLVRHIRSAHRRDLACLQMLEKNISTTQPKLFTAMTPIAHQKFSLPDTSQLLISLSELSNVGTMHISERAEIEQIKKEWQEYLTKQIKR